MKLTDFTIALLLDGDLDLNGPNTDPSGLEFRIEALGEGLEWGNPEGITKMVSRWLADGSVVTQDGADNRTLVVPIRIQANTSQALAAGEAAVMHRCGRQTILVWTPPQPTDDTPISTVFDVWLATLEGDIQGGGAGDLNELVFERYYTLTLDAAPYARSRDLVLVAAPQSTPLTDETFVNTTLDDCSSTSGWSGSPHAVALGGTTDESVAETVTTIKSSRWWGNPWTGAPRYTLTLTKTFGSAVDMTDAPYLVIKMNMPGITWTQKVTVDGQPCQLVSQANRVYTFALPAGVTSFTVLKITGQFFTTQAMTVPLRVFNVRATNNAGSFNTGKQTARSFWVDGSARTYGAVAVHHDTTALGDVVVYTVPSSAAGYVPAMQHYQTDGPAPTTDGTAVTGVKQHIDDTTIGGGAKPTFTIPVDQLLEGQYGVAARVKVASADDYRITVEANVDGHFADPETESLTSRVTFADTAYTIQWLGTLNLPPLTLPPESDQNVIVTVEAALAPSGTTGDVFLDELWLFNLTDGAVSIIHAGTKQRLWLDSEDGERLNPSVLRGNEADRSDAVGADLVSTVMVLGQHRLIPGRMDMFTATTGVTDAAADATYYPRWHTHAAR